MTLVSFTRGFAFGLGGQSRILAQPERKVTRTKMAMDHLPTISVVPSKREFLSLSLSQGPNGPSGQRAVAKAGPSAKKRLTKRSRRWRWPWRVSNVICLMWREGADKVSGDFFNGQTLFRLSFYVLCVSVFACSREKREAFRPGVARSRPKSHLVPLKGASDKIRELIFPTNLDQLERFGKFIHFSVPSSDTPQMRFEWMNVCEHGQSMG